MGTRLKLFAHLNFKDASTANNFVGAQTQPQFSRTQKADPT